MEIFTNLSEGLGVVLPIVLGALLPWLREARTIPSPRARAIRIAVPAVVLVGVVVVSSFNSYNKTAAATAASAAAADAATKNATINDLKIQGGTLAAALDQRNATIAQLQVTVADLNRRIAGLEAVETTRQMGRERLDALRLRLEAFLQKATGAEAQASACSASTGNLDDLDNYFASDLRNNVRAVALATCIEATGKVRAIGVAAFFSGTQWTADDPRDPANANEFHVRGYETLRLAGTDRTRSQSYVLVTTEAGWRVIAIGEWQPAATQ